MKLLPVQATDAPIRHYSYDSITYDIRVNKDSTIAVSERQSYRFVGEYHQGWREIPKNKFDDLSDVTVVDAETGRPLLSSPSRLEKTDPASWGKYTTFTENGKFIIEWYYDARDTTKTWTLGYVVHGAIGFYENHDELYWNLFTDYAVPIGHVEATVTLPSAIDGALLKASSYAEPTSISGTWTKESGSFRFVYDHIPPQGKVTIAPGWPKGIVDEGAYWRGFLLGIWGYLGAALAVLLTIATLVLRWFFTERWNTGRGTIVPEYDPPRNLRPAEAEVIVTETLTDKAWVATIIDLAVRGHIGIREVQRVSLGDITKLFKETPARVAFGCSFLPFLIALLAFFLFSSPAVKGAISLIVLALVSVIWKNRSALFFPDYILTRLNAASDESLETYEKTFLETMFPTGKKSFSTKDMRTDVAAAELFRKKLLALRGDVLGETVTDTAGYEVGFRAWKYVAPGLLVAGFVLVTLLFSAVRSQPAIFLSVSAYCFLAIVLFFRYNPRLNRDGQVLREEWLGFKLYLETAERYRMQNLTPETFEKYLPYAIIFGIEEKWGKAFEGIAMENPSWYSHGAAGASSSFSSPGTAFSAAAFSSSFASSFSSAFSRSGGGSGSSGGGSAGGGGGGGGGGAS